MSSTQISGFRSPNTRSPLSAPEASQYVDLGIVREQGTAPRSNDAMIINNQNAH